MTPLPIADHAPEKPRMGEPCNGCGGCCAAEVCAVGKAMHGDTPAPCPSMRYRDRRFYCRAVELADEMGEFEGKALRLIMGIGHGCDAEFSWERAQQ